MIGTGIPGWQGILAFAIVLGFVSLGMAWFFAASAPWPESIIFPGLWLAMACLGFGIARLIAREELRRPWP